MAKYTITGYRGDTKIYRRKDSAAHALLVSAHTALSAFGLLDTKAGHTWYAEITRVASDIASGTTLDFHSNFLPTTTYQVHANPMKEGH